MADYGLVADLFKVSDRIFSFYFITDATFKNKSEILFSIELQNITFALWLINFAPLLILANGNVLLLNY